MKKNNKKKKNEPINCPRKKKRKKCILEGVIDGKLVGNFDGTIVGCEVTDVGEFVPITGFRVGINVGVPVKKLIFVHTIN